MMFFDVLLERYADQFSWFSLRVPSTNSENPYKIPYGFAPKLTRPARISWLRNYLNLKPWARYLGKQAADFGRRQNVDVIFADLAFEAVVAGRVAAEKLNVPLLVSIHDDPVERLKIKGYPQWLLKLHESDFSKTIKSAQRCGVICDYMGDIYQEKYKINTTTLFIGVEPDKCLPQKEIDLNKTPITIGSVGSMNSFQNWNKLIDAVSILNEKFGKGKFQILHIGDLTGDFHIPKYTEVTGWVPEEDFQRHLSRMDVGFLNWSFEPLYAEASKTSFPLKINSYIQAQIPMVAFGPVSSTIVRFIGDYECGVTCTHPSPENLSGKIEELLSNRFLYDYCLSGVQLLNKRFSRDNFFRQFEAFIHI